MFVILIDQWIAEFSFLNLFRYLTFRSICAALTAMAVTLILGPTVIKKLTQHKIGETIREDGPSAHKDKSGTPTMGGIMILASVLVTILLWGDLENRYIWLVISVCGGFGLLGLVDDGRKLILKHSAGVGIRQKLLIQCIISLMTVWFLYANATSGSETSLQLPMYKDLLIPLGLLFIPWSVLVIVGTSNAVNLTDGLDGLAILPCVMVAGGLGIYAYVSGHVVFADYLGFPYIAESGELLIFCAALVGAGLGFLWFNTHPALIFMGDTGSLSIGASLGMIAVIIRQEVILLIMGGLFVIEALSVILQVTSYKMMGKRIFKMSPLHHHFELKGWPEQRVCVRFWVISFVLLLIGLAFLKVR